MMLYMVDASWSDKEGTTSYTYDDRGLLATTTSYNKPQNKTISASFYDNGSVNILATPMATSPHL